MRALFMRRSSSCIRWRRMPATRISCRRRLCIEAGECAAPVQGKFYSSRVEEPDGRVFRFTTLVTDSMKQGQSALPFWSQACSILGTGSPTLALIFVSRPVPSAVAAVTEFCNVARAAPLIGCVADIWEVGAPSPGDAEGRSDRKGNASRRRQVPVAGAGKMQGSVGQKLGHCPHREAVSADDDDEFADFKALMSDCTTWSRENPGVVPYGNSLGAIAKEVKASPGEVKHILEDSKQKSFLQEGVVEASTGTENNVSKAPPEEVGNTEPKEGPLDDEAYRMILCLCHLPGAKAVSFHASTTGIPYLPDMEAAVTRNNPHMILLGAPGYIFPELVQRLSSIFPDSYRAGAFLAPLFNSLDQRPDKTKALFCGPKIVKTGVVGVAVSASDENVRIPVSAMGELVRMSIGMARMTGHILFDNAISNRLFFPKNVVVRRAGAKSSTVDPTAFLKRLDAYLLQRSKVQDQTTSMSMASGVSGKEAGVQITIDGTKTCTMKSSASVEEPDTSSDAVPLALMDTVLFPGCSMPLHIHEPRYRRMVKDCVEQGRPFGLISYCEWQSSDELIGTLANLKVYLFEKDCRSFIVAHGLRRFRVPLNKLAVQPGCFGLNVGQVEFFDDSEDDERETSVDLAKQLAERCRKHIFQPDVDVPPELTDEGADNPAKVSFAVAQILPVPTRIKRRWLGIVDTKSRLLEQLTFLDK